MATPMKLFIWSRGVLTDWSDGMAVAMAEDVEHARVLIVAREVNVRGHKLAVADQLRRQIAGDPDEVHDEPAAVWIFGGA